MAAIATTTSASAAAASVTATATATATTVSVAAPVDVALIITTLAMHVCSELEAKTTTPVTILAHVLTLVNALPAFKSASNAERAAICTRTLLAVSQQIEGDAQLSLTVRNVAATAEVVLDLVQAASSTDASATASVSASAGMGSSVGVPPPPDLMAVYTAGAQIVKLVRDARTGASASASVSASAGASAGANADSGSGVGSTSAGGGGGGGADANASSTLSPAAILALVPSILQALSAIRAVWNAPPADAVRFVQEVVSEVAADAPASEADTWAVVLMGVGPAMYALQLARAQLQKIDFAAIEARAAATCASCHGSCWSWLKSKSTK